MNPTRAHTERLRSRAQQLRQDHDRLHEVREALSEEATKAKRESQALLRHIEEERNRRR
jgi:vacuolar-type H+-ATPase subunit D/Vma8